MRAPPQANDAFLLSTANVVFICTDCGTGSDKPNGQHRCRAHLAPSQVTGTGRGSDSTPTYWKRYNIAALNDVNAVEALRLSKLAR